MPRPVAWLHSHTPVATLCRMHDDDALDAATAVTAFAARLAKDPHLAAEMQRARREYFADAGQGPTVSGAADAATLRFHEWFTLERESEVLGAVPVEVPAWSGEAADLADSSAGLWLVQQVGQQGVEARDLQEGTSLELEVPADTLLPGDLVVGRLFDRGAGRWAPSTAAAIFRPGVEIAKALMRDLERLGLDRRLQQIELEHLLLRRRPVTDPAPADAGPPEVPLEHLEADLDRLLERSASEHAASAISQQLAIAVRPGPVMGPLLDELAFETDVDLDRARALMLAIWNAHHRGEDPEPTAAAVPEAPGESLGERLVRTLDEGLAQKRDVGELFAQLERMAGIEPEPDDEDAADDESDEDDAAPRSAIDDEDETDDAANVDEGNLGPLVEEYLWESGRSDEPADAPLRLFASLQRNAALPHRDLESITAKDVLRVLLHVYLGSTPSERAARVRAAFEELRGFFRWASEVQEMVLEPVLEGCRGPLVDELDRLQAAGLALSTAPNGRSRPGVLEVEAVDAKGFGVRDDDGGDHWLLASAAALPHLRVGDLVLGALAPTANGRQLSGLVVVLPADARSLIE